MFFASCDIGMKMQITEITIRLTKEGLVRAYVNIVFDNCFMVEEIRVIEGPKGLFVSFPAKRQSDGTYIEFAYPANAETRQMIQGVILAEYKKVVAASGEKADAKE
jgi:stage V sporulation protein G